MLRRNKVTELDSTKTGLICVQDHSDVLMVKILYVFGLFAVFILCFEWLHMYIRFLFEACFSADLRCCTMFTTI